jgi:hypothetical protein
MKKIIILTSAILLLFTIVAQGGKLPSTNVSNILEHKSSLQLTDSQVKKLQIIENLAKQKMIEAKVQADIRLAEIEKFSSNWTSMNGVAMRALVNEYYDFLAKLKNAEVEAIIQARGILSAQQLRQFQQLASIEALMVKMDNNYVSF